MRKLINPMKSILSALCILFSIQASAVNYFWVGGTGNWSDYANHWAVTSGGSIFHTTIPTLYDNVIFDASSFTADSQVVTLDGTFIYCNNMDWSNVQHAVELQANGGLSSIYPLNVFGSLILSPNLYEFNGAIKFSGITPGAIINTAGVAIDDFVLFDGSGSWDLVSDLECEYVTFTSGSFNSNNHTIRAYNIIANSASNPVVNMGSSELHCLILQIHNNLNFDGSNCKVYFDFPSTYVSTLICINHTFRNIYFEGIENLIQGSVIADSIFFYGEGTINPMTYPAGNTLNCNYIYFGDKASLRTSPILTSNIGHAVIKNRYGSMGLFTFDTLELDNSGYAFGIFDTIVINDTMIVSGSCSAYIDIVGGNYNPGNMGYISKSSGIVELNYVRMENIQAIGGATFIANNSFDLGSNSGWQFNMPSSRDLYWVNGMGNWSDASHWALTSGGSGGNCPPSQADNVFFDILSFNNISDSVTIDQQNVYSNNFTLQAPLFAPVFYRWFNGVNNQIFVYGNLLLQTDAVALPEFILSSDNLGNIIQTGPVEPNLKFKGAGEWSMIDDIICKSIYIYAGTFNSNNFNITSDIIYAGPGYPDPKPDVLLGTSTIHTRYFYTSYIDTHLVSQNANIVFDTTFSAISWGYMNVNSQTFNSVHFLSKGIAKGTFGCNELIFEQNDSILSGIVTVQNLVIHDDSFIEANINADSIIQATPGKLFEFGLWGTINIGSAFLVGGISCDQLTTLTAKGSAVLNKSSGSVDLDFLFLENILTGGGATFNATNTIDAGGNVGWNISSPTQLNLFWVGGSGNWSDQAHWALSSGGTGGNCVPNIHDNVFFDDNSFIPTGTEIVVVDLAEVACADFNYSVTYINKNFNIYANEIFNIYGSLNLNNKTSFTNPSSYRNDFYLLSDSATSTLKTSDTYLNNLYVSGSGTYTLADSLNCYALFLEDGNFITDGNALNCRGLTMNTDSAGIDFGSSILYCNALDCRLAGSGFISQGLSILYNTNVGNTSLRSNNQVFQAITADMFHCYGGISCTYGNFTEFTYSPSDTSQHLYIKSGTFSGTTTFDKGTNPLLPLVVTFDTLILDNAGDLVRVRDGMTLRINDTLIVNNSPGFPTELKCYRPLPNSGDHFYIEKPSGVLCMDNMIMEGVHTSGNGIYFAGANSVSLANNQGWTFVSCNPNNSDVWPGDANYELIVDNFDVLHVGLAYNSGGPVRNGASNSWVGQPAADWPFQFANGANLKNADCDGNGTVDNQDTTAISQNYGMSHPPRLSSPLLSSLPPVQLYVLANPDTVAEGDTVQIEVYLGTSAVPIDSIYGIAFSLLFDTAMVDTSYIMPFDYSGSWMGVQGVDLLNFEKQFLGQGRVDIALTRTDHLNVSGDGIILTTGVVVVDNIGARLNVAPPFVTLPISIVNPRALTASEYYLAVNAQDGGVEIDTTGFVSLPDDLNDASSILLYPNPASGITRLYSSKAPINKVTMFNQFGNAVRTYPGGMHQVVLLLNELPASVYTLMIETDKGTIYKKLVVNEHQGR